MLKDLRFTFVKRVIHLKKKNSVITHSPSSHSKPVSSYFCVERYIKINQSVSICVPWKNSNYRFGKWPKKKKKKLRYSFTDKIIWQKKKNIHWNVTLWLSGLKKQTVKTYQWRMMAFYVVQSPAIWWLWLPWFVGAVRLTNDTFTNLCLRGL